MRQQTKYLEQVLMIHPVSDLPQVDPTLTPKGCWQTHFTKPPRLSRYANVEGAPKGLREVTNFSEHRANVRSSSPCAGRTL